MPQAGGYLGTFTLDPVSEAGGSGSVAWHYSVDNADIQFLAQGQTLVQTYTVLVTDDHGATTTQDVTIAINGANDAPTAVGENIITNVGPDGLVGIQAWMLGANDTDPDTIDHLFANNVVSSSGGDAVTFGDVFFLDDSTLGGSFTYTSSDGIATSGNAGDRNRHQQLDLDHRACRNRWRRHHHRHQRHRNARWRRRQRHPGRQFRQPCHDRRHRQRQLRLPADHRTVPAPSPTSTT